MNTLPMIFVLMVTYLPLIACLKDKTKTELCVLDILDDFNKMKKSIAKPKAKTKKTPAFFAVSRKVNAAKGGQTVRFDQVKLNTGGKAIPFNPKTGIFTATRKGLYYFSAMILGNRRNAVHYQLNKNKEIYLLGYSHRGRGADSSTISAIMELKVGDKVYVRHRGKRREYFHANGHSTFTGHLIGD